MFCTKCGAKVADGSAFCTACGNRIGAVPAQPVVQRPVQPVQQPVQPVQQPVQPVQQPVQPAQQPAKPALPKVNIKLPKLEKAADGEKKPFVNPFAGNKPLLLKALSIVCALLLVLSYVASLNTSFEKIPIVSMAFSMAGDEDTFDDLSDEFDKLADQLEDGYDKQEDELKDLLSKKEIKSLEKFIEITRDCSKSFSLNNLSRLLSCYEDLADTDLAGLSHSISDAVDDAKEIQSILSIIKTFLLIGALGCAVFVFCGGFFAKPGLAIFGTVLTVFYGLSFCPILMLLLNLAAQIYMIILARQVKKEKKAAEAVAMA